MPVTPLSSYEQFKAATSGDRIAVIDFWATWCGPCRVIGPVFEKLSDSPLGEKLAFYKVDVDLQEKIAAECKVTAMPTFIFFKNGDIIRTVVGANPGALNTAINELAATC